MGFIIDAIKNALEWIIRDIIWNAVMSVWSFISSRLVKHPIIAAVLFLVISLVIGLVWTTGF